MCNDVYMKIYLFYLFHFNVIVLIAKVLKLLTLHHVTAQVCTCSRFNYLYTY